MRSDPRNAEQRPLLEAYVLRQLRHLGLGDDAELSGRSERSIALRAEAPNPLANPPRADAVSDFVDDPCAIAMRDDTGVRHPDAERVLPLFDIPRVHPGHSDTDAQLTGPRHRFGHLPHNERLVRRTLLFVPRSSHLGL